MGGKLNNIRDKLLDTIDNIIDNGFDGSIKDAAAAYKILVESPLPDTDAPIQSEKYSYSGLPARFLGKAFVDVYRAIHPLGGESKRRFRHFDFKGGRGSLKSSFCALVLVDAIMRNPDICAAALRQFITNLESSVYSQIVWAIDVLGLSHEFACTSSPLRIRRKSTGQIIYFRGGADPLKLKSLKPPRGMHIGIVWFEEKDQFNGMEAVRSIIQSLMRGGDDVIVLSSYNTPASGAHFINADAAVHRTDRIIHHSTYLDSPPEWLGEAFLSEAEQIKCADERVYRHEYLGESVGFDGNVFENLTVRDITESELKSANAYLYGVDFGFYPDPWAFVKCFYLSSNRTLYVVGETKAYKKSNPETARLILESGIHSDEVVICDSAEPKSIADYREAGIYAIAADKSPGSLNASIRWMQGLAGIVIDPVRAPYAAAEFSAYEYEKTRSGEFISAFPDKNNHFIDAVRYATSHIRALRG